MPKAKADALTLDLLGNLIDSENTLYDCQRVRQESWRSGNA
jgi:hypothetical protein